MTDEQTDEQIQMEEATNEAAAEANVTGEHALSTTTSSRALATPIKSVGIAGMEEIPTSLMAIPYCRLIQPTSKKTETTEGHDAVPGNFLFNDTQREVGELSFVLLRAKHEHKRVDETGEFVDDSYTGPTTSKQQVSILGITTDETEKLFILSLSITSFSGFGRLIAKFKELHVDKTWRFKLKATSEKQENKKGKYFVVKFQIEQELEGEALQHMEEKALEYGLALDRKVEEPVE